MNSEDTVRFIYVGPVVLFFWRLIGVVALAALFAWLALLSYGKTPRLPGMPRKAVAHAACCRQCWAWRCCSARGGVARAQASAGKSRDRPARRAQDAAHGRAGLRAALRRDHRGARDGRRRSARGGHAGQRARHRGGGHAARQRSLAARRSQRGLRADRSPSRATSDASLWVPLTAGRAHGAAHGPAGRGRILQLAFPQPPRVIDVSARGWTTSGVNEGRLVSGSLELARERDAERSSADARGRQPSFRPSCASIACSTSISTGRVDTFVTRIAPQRAALSVEIPLVSRRIGAHRRREGAQQRSRRSWAWARASRRRNGTPAWRAPRRSKSRCPRMRRAPKSGASSSIRSGTWPSKASRRCCPRT